MNIAIVGYGKMGHMIKNAAERLGHRIVLTADPAASDADVKPASAEDTARAVKSSGAEGVIEFSRPSVAVENMYSLLPLSIPLVVGTTGWTESLPAVEKRAADTGGALLYSSNFSIGVNMFYKIVSEAARLMKDCSDYDVAVWEAHHNQKADSPSGTALEIARRIMAEYTVKTKIVSDSFHRKPEENELSLASTRCGSNPGEHTVFFDGQADTIELTHRARSREGFAFGAVRSLERFSSALKTGTLQKGRVYTMQDIF